LASLCCGEDVALFFHANQRAVAFVVGVSTEAILISDVAILRFAWINRAGATRDCSSTDLITLELSIIIALN
jgi:hypothetical protein